MRMKRKIQLSNPTAVVNHFGFLNCGNVPTENISGVLSKKLK
jgi:predicted nuclease of predicted toxin-antitoxin system